MTRSIGKKRWRCDLLSVLLLMLVAGILFCLKGANVNVPARTAPYSDELCVYQFDDKYYLEHSPDVLTAKIEPGVHFLRSGWREGREISFRRVRGAMPEDSITLHVPRCDQTHASASLDIGSKESTLSWEWIDRPSFSRISLQTDAPQRLNIILPGWDFQHFFGGMISIAQFSLAMANQGMQIRWISLSSSPTDRYSKEELVVQFAKLKGLESLYQELEFVTNPRVLECSPNDVFMATLYSTAELASSYQSHMSKKRFLYFIQDYEPIFFAHSSAYAHAMMSYGLPHMALYGTHYLQSYFQKYAIGVFGHPEWDSAALSYQNGISAAIKITSELLRRPLHEKRRILFYLRIEKAHARNMWELSLAALSEAVRTRSIDPDSWLFHGIGSVGSTERKFCGLGGQSDVCLHLLPKVGQKQYEHMLTQYDIGVALMLSPHPSLVPLDFAAAGLVTITNTYDTKTHESLRWISGNILPCEPSREAISAALGHAVILTKDLDRRAQQSSLNWTTTWTSEAAFGIQFGEHIRRRYGITPPLVVFIVRTFAGHFTSSSVNTFAKMLRSLQALRYPHWQAEIYVSDPRESRWVCQRIDSLVASLGDSRVHWQRTVASEEFEYFSNGYRFMDAFAQKTVGEIADWLVFTNGDNEYLPDALDHLNPAYDAIALNFYSRYSSAGFFLNTGSVGGADLGSVILKRERWVKEKRRFSDMPSTISQDGAMFQLLQNEGWLFKFFDKNSIQFSHNPNPVGCARLGGVWLASPRFDEQTCLSEDEAAHRIASGELLNSNDCLAQTQCVVYPEAIMRQKRLEETRRDAEFFKIVCERTKAERKFGKPVGFPELRWKDCSGLFQNAADEALVRRNLIRSERSYRHD